jgi:hypothetical protein
MRPSPLNEARDRARQLAARRETGAHAGELGAGERKCEQGLSEDLAVGGVASGGAQRRAHHAASARGGLHASTHHARHREVEALAFARFFPDEVLRGHEEVLE